MVERGALSLRNYNRREVSLQRTFRHSSNEAGASHWPSVRKGVFWIKYNSFTTWIKPGACWDQKGERNREGKTCAQCNHFYGVSAKKANCNSKTMFSIRVPFGQLSHYKASPYFMTVAKKNEVKMMFLCYKYIWRRSLDPNYYHRIFTYSTITKITKIWDGLSMKKSFVVLWDTVNNYSMIVITIICFI